MIPLDLLATAIDHEYKSRAFYEAQGNRDWEENALYALFAFLTEEEGRHEGWLRDFYQIEGDLEVAPAASAPPIPEALLSLTPEASREEVLKAAMASEREAAAFYGALLDQSSDQKERQLLKTLVEAEEAHAKKIERLMIG